MSTARLLTLGHAAKMLLSRAGKNIARVFKMPLQGNNQIDSSKTYSIRWIDEQEANDEKRQTAIERTNAILSTIWGNLQVKKNNVGVTIEDALLNINTHMRKRAKVKREKLKQRRKKIRRLSERKREKYNY